MILKIDEKLRALRAKSKITQKSLAEYLGVSEQAISRWESGTCYPDIEYLPAIASFFGVTTDELLGCDKSKSEEERILCELNDLLIKGQTEEAISLARSSLAVRPDNAAIMMILALQLFSVGISNIRTNKEEAARVLEESVAWGKRLLSLKNVDDIETVRNSARTFVIRGLCALGRRDEAAEFAHKAPPVSACREFLIPEVLEGDARSAYLKEAVMLIASNMQSSFFTRKIYGVSFDYQNELAPTEKEKFLRRSIAVYDALYAAVEDEFPEAKCSLFQYGYCHLRLARLLLDRGEREECLLHLNIAIDGALCVDRADDMRQANQAALNVVADADRHCAGSRKDYEGKSCAYFLLHGFIENGFMDELGAEVLDDIRRRLAGTA